MRNILTPRHYGRLFFAIAMMLVLQAGLVSRVSAGQVWTSDRYQKAFDSILYEHGDMLDSAAASGRGSTYYTFSYALDGILGMYEGTGDLRYLEQALAWGETMVAKAKITDTDGLLNWSGDWASPYSRTPISYHLYDLLGATQLSRLARLIVTDSRLKSSYGSRGFAIYRFVKEH